MTTYLGTDVLCPFKTISSFRCGTCTNFFGIAILTRQSFKYLPSWNQIQMGLEKCFRSSAPSAAVAYIWKPLHPGLQKLHAFVSPHVNPKRYSGHRTSSECNASTRCCKAAWHWNQRNSHRRRGYRRYICARERRHRCCCDDRYLKRQQTAVSEIGDAKAGKRRPLWSPHPRVRIWEHIIWDLVPLRRLSEPWLRSSIHVSGFQNTLFDCSTPTPIRTVIEIFIHVLGFENTFFEILFHPHAYLKLDWDLHPCLMFLGTSFEVLFQILKFGYLNWGLHRRLIFPKVFWSPARRC